MKKTVKEWKKDGWLMLASSTIMEYALLKYRTYFKSDEDNHVEKTGGVSGRIFMLLGVLPDSNK